MADDARVWVGGLPEKITKEEIEDEYKRFGKINNIAIHGKPDQHSFAFLQFADTRDAEDAVRATDQAKLFGMPFVKVNWSGKGSKGKGKARRSPSRRRSPRRQSRSPRRRSPSPKRSRSRKARSSPSRRRDASPPRRRDSPARSPPKENGRGQDRRQASRSPPRRLPPPPAPPAADSGRRKDSRAPQRAERESSRGRDRPQEDDRREQPAPRRQDSRAPQRGAPPSDRSRGQDDRRDRPATRSPYPQRSDRRDGREDDGGGDRAPPRRASRSPGPAGGGQHRQPTHTKPSEQKGQHRIKIENLPDDMGWQELKSLGTDLAKNGKCTFSRTNRDHTGVLEFTSLDDMNHAIKELDGRRFSGGAQRLRAYEERDRRY